MTVSITAAHANNAAARIQTAEASVKLFESGGQTNNSSYPYQLLGLANAYKANGQDVEAHAAFRKAIAAGSKISNFDVPGMMMGWAMSLTHQAHTPKEWSPSGPKVQSPNAAQAADLREAEKIVTEGLAIVSKLPADSVERLNYMVETISFYKMLRKQHEMEIQLRSFDALTQAIETAQKRQITDDSRIADNLVAVSQIICEAPLHMEFTAMPEKTLVPDSEAPSPFTARQSEFEAAEKYELRAIALYDKLPENNRRRIEAHRRLAKWYGFFNQTNQEKAQTQILSKLLNTTDPNLLFPRRDPCLGCGRG